MQKGQADMSARLLNAIAALLSVKGLSWFYDYVILICLLYSVILMMNKHVQCERDPVSKSIISSPVRDDDVPNSTMWKSLRNLASQTNKHF